MLPTNWTKMKTQFDGMPGQSRGSKFGDRCGACLRSWTQREEKL
jgi:hypothetical protein